MDIRTVAIALVGYIYYFWVSDYFHFHFLLLNSATVMVSFWYSCLKWQLLKKISEDKNIYQTYFRCSWNDLTSTKAMFYSIMLIINVYLFSKSESLK